MLTKNQCLAARETIRANKIIKCQTQNDKKKQKQDKHDSIFSKSIYTCVFKTKLALVME